MQTRIGDALVQKGLLSTEQLEQALKLKVSSKKRLGEIFVDLGYLSREQVVANLYAQLYERIRDVLEPLAQLELVIAEAYALCAEIFPDRRDLWRILVQQETDHAEYIRRMISIAYEKPHLFEMGFPLRREAVETVIAGIRDAIAKIRKGEIPKNRIVVFMTDLEKSLIENRFFDILKSADPEFNGFIRKIRQETFSHRKTLEDLTRAPVSGKPS